MVLVALRILVAVIVGQDPAAEVRATQLGRRLRDAGHEVVYLGSVTEQVLEAVAVQEDVDVTCTLDGGEWRASGADEDGVRVVLEVAGSLVTPGDPSVA